MKSRERVPSSGFRVQRGDEAYDKAHDKEMKTKSLDKVALKPETRVTHLSTQLNPLSNLE